MWPGRGQLTRLPSQGLSPAPDGGDLGHVAHLIWVLRGIFGEGALAGLSCHGADPAVSGI